MGSIGIIGGADGPTAVLGSGFGFIDGFIIGAVAGVIVTLAIVGIVKLIKKNKK